MATTTLKKKAVQTAGCFPAGTKVNTPNGYKNIEDIKKGDLVYAFTLKTHEVGINEFPGVVGIREVSKRHKHAFGDVGYESPLLVIKYEGKSPSGNELSGELKVTGNHYILTPSRQSPETDKGFARADELQVGDTLFMEYGEEVHITSIEQGEEYDFVYNFEVKEFKTYIASKIRVHNGGGGKGKPVKQDPDSYNSNQIIRILLSPGEGEIGGLVDGAGNILGASELGKGVYFDNRPLIDANGVENFGPITVRQRVGTPDQSVIDGFSAVESEVPLGDEITVSAPVSRTMSADHDAVRLTISFAGLLFANDKGKEVKAKVEFTIQKRTTTVPGAPWETEWNNVPVEELVRREFSRSYKVRRPSTPGAWEWRVVRNTPTSTNLRLQNKSYLKSYTQIEDVALPYNNRALVAITVGADRTGGRIPQIALDIAGRLIRVPTGWTKNGRTPATWDGSFSTEMEWCDNPLWVALDQMGHERYGAGEFLKDNQVLMSSFFTAARYADQMVSDGQGTGTFTPRYTFNQQIMERKAVYLTVGAILALADCKLFEYNGLIYVAQDRPETPTLLIGNSAVEGGKFTYSTTREEELVTAANITFSNPYDNFLPKTITERATPTEIARFGYRSIDLAAWGCNNEGQARRAARRAIYTSLLQRQTVAFTTGLEYAHIKPHEVISLFDETFAQVSQEGRVVAFTTNTITLDQPMVISTGVWKISVYNADAKTINEHTILNTPGTYTTLSVSGGVTTHNNSMYIVTGAVSPRQFRIVQVEEKLEDNTLKFTFLGVLHAPGKYAFVEDGTAIQDPVYWQQPDLNQQSMPTDLEVTPTAYINDKGQVQRGLAVSWLAPVDNTANTYMLRWTDDGGPYMEQRDLRTPYFVVPTDSPGLYRFYVTAINAAGTHSATLTGTYNLETLEGDGSPLQPPQDFWTKDGGLVFQEDDLVVRWRNPAANESIAQAVATKDFKLVISHGEEEKETIYLPAVAPGEVGEYTYSYGQNLNHGGPRRSITMQLQIRDTLDKLTVPITKTFTNPAPGVPTNIEVLSGIGSNKISFIPPRDSDYEGTLVWFSTSTPIQRSRDTLLFDGTDNYIAHSNLSPGVTYYYQMATYDSFAKSYSGEELVLTAVFSATPASSDASKNKLNNSDFESRQAGNRPTYWEKYGSVAASYELGTGFESEKSFALRVTANGTGPLGLKPALGDASGVGVEGGWSANQTYTVTGYARRSVDATGVTNLRFDWTTPPVEFTWISNPTLSVEYQRFEARIKWGSSVEPRGNLALGALGSFTVGNLLEFDRLQVEEGDVGTSWQQRLKELIDMPAINVTGQLQADQIAAMETWKLLGTVTDAQIAGIAASKVTGQLTSEQIGMIDAAKIAGQLSAEQLAAISATAITGQIKSTQIEDGSISTPKLAAGSITTAKLAAGSVVAGSIAANAITSEKISAGAVSAREIAAGAVIADKIAANSVSAAALQAGSVVAGKIAAGSIQAYHLAAGAITTGKLFVSGQGRALNADPATQDIEAWIGQNTTQFGIGAPGTPSGLNCIVFAAVGAGFFRDRQRVPVTPGIRYKFTATAVCVAGTASQTYMRVYRENINNAQIGYLVTAMSPQASGYLEGMTVPTSWTRYTGYFTPEAGTVGAYIGVHMNATATIYITDLRIEEYVHADLIVDGSISASKITAGSITADKIAANQITSQHIVAGAIDAGKIAAFSITADKIAVGAITGDKIVANSIHGDRIQFGTINGGSIIANTLRIREGDIEDLTVTTLKIRQNAISGTSWAGPSRAVKEAGGSFATWRQRLDIFIPTDFAKVLFVCKAGPPGGMASNTLGPHAVVLRLNGTNHVYDLVPVTTYYNSDFQPSQSLGSWGFSYVVNMPYGNWSCDLLTQGSPDGSGFLGPILYIAAVQLMR